MSGWVSGGLALGGALLSGGMASSSSKKAASAARKAQRLQEELIRKQQGTNQTLFNNYIDYGGDANSMLANLLGINTRTMDKLDPEAEAEVQRMLGDSVNRASTNEENVRRQVAAGWGRPITYTETQGSGDLLKKFSQGDLDNDVVYNTVLQFGLDQGLTSLDRLYKARGNSDSGAALKALTRYANDYGTTKANDSYNRFMNDKNFTYNTLSGMSDRGLNATSNLASLNSGLATQQAGAIANGMTAANNYNVMGAEGVNNAIQGGLSNTLTALLRSNNPWGSGSGGGSSNVSAGLRLSGSDPFKSYLRDY